MRGLVFAWMVLAAPAYAATEEVPGEKAFVGCSKYPESKKFKWSVRGEVGVAELVASLGEISCQAILVGPQVGARSGKVTLEVPDLLTAPEVYRLFYSSLEVLGLTVEPAGKTLKIVDAGRAKEVSRQIGDGESTPGGEQYVTRLLRLKHARPAEVSEIVSRIKSKEGDVAPYAAGSALVVTDRAQVVRRMEELLVSLDVPRSVANERVFTLATHAQSATELAATLEKILMASRRAETEKNAAGAGPGPIADGVGALVPIDAARMVAVIGNEDGFKRVRALAVRIDPPAAADSGGQTHVIYLMHTNAEEMATTLQGLGLAGRGGAPAGRPGAAPVPVAAPVSADVRIAADKVSNAIVVFAGAGDFAMVRDLITRLDLPRRQVFVEAVILDVSVDRTRELGLVFHNGSAVGDTGATAVVANSERGGLNTLTLDAKTIAGAVAGGGLLTGIIGPAINVAGTSIPSFGVMIKALEFTKDVNVISKPHLLTMDNVKAQLSVGQTFPVQTGGVVTPAGQVSTGFGRQEVSLKLDLTPHLNDSDSVRLEIDGEISDVPDGATNNPGGPVTNKRVLKTAVVVRDGETVVLGGLQKESFSETVSKIPFIGDIPVLGRLFQTRSKQRIKQDLLILLTPHVIRSSDDLRRIHQQREDERREFLERSGAFKDESVYSAHVDYRRKRGLLEEINLVARQAESEAAAVRAAEKVLRPEKPEGLVD